MKKFQITVRSQDHLISYDAIAHSSAAAFESASDRAGEEPCGITVISASPADGCIYPAAARRDTPEGIVL